MINKVKDLLEYTDSLDNLYLFGAGVWAEKYWQLWSKYNIRLDGCIVSARGNNPLTFHDKPVYALDELKEVDLDVRDINIIVALKDSSKETWIPFFNSIPQFHSVLFFSKALEDDLKIWHWRWVLKEEFEKKNASLRLDLHPRAWEVDIGALVDINTNRAIMRMPSYMCNQILEQTLEHCRIENYEKLYGALSLLPEVEDKCFISDQMAKDSQIQMYVVTNHADRIKGDLKINPAEIPIQAGAALTPYRSGILTDDTGDNISERNSEYSECSALYWIWKNAKASKYIGISHYRRRLKVDDNSMKYIIAEDIDIVPTLPQFEAVCIKEFFLDFIEEYDWELLREQVIKYDPVYEDIFHRYENGHFYFPCNVFLWKREWFEKFCEFAFNVTNPIYELFYRAGAVRGDRYIGYLFEQLSSIFIMRHITDLKIACAELKWMV